MSGPDLKCLVAHTYVLGAGRGGRYEAIGGLRVGVRWGFEAFVIDAATCTFQQKGRRVGCLSQKSAKSAGCLKSQGLLGTAPLVTTRHEYVSLAQSPNTKDGRHSPFSTGIHRFFLQPCRSARLRKT